MPGRKYITNKRFLRMSGGKVHTMNRMVVREEKTPEMASKEQLERTIQNKPVMDKLISQMNKMKVKTQNTRNKTPRQRISLEF